MFELEKQTVGRIISDAINRLGHWEDEAAKELANDHPTLQQTFMRLALAYIKIQSEKSTGSTDLRNLATVTLCKKIALHLEYEDWYSLPMV